MSAELHAKRIEEAQKAIDLKRDECAKGAMRQHYHFMPEAGWINDPNGLIYFRGMYHYFYQFNPYDAFWGSMHWGHAVSKDLIHWEYLPVALAPSESYDDDPDGGCFSGSAIEVDGRLWIIYTGTSHVTGAGVGQHLEGGEGSQVQCLAYSDDGIHFEKYAGNPVITAPEGFNGDWFRDPKIWKHGDYYYVVCGCRKGEKAQALLFRSRDIKNWEFFNVLAESVGEWGYMWECPDFYQIEDRFVLMFSPMEVPGRHTMYLVGDFNYDTGKFIYTTVGQCDWGLDYYAPQTFVDKKGRRLAVSWANAWKWMPWCRDWGPTFKEGWCGSFNIVREVKLGADSTLRFVPVEELETLRYEPQEAEDLEIGTERYPIPAADGTCFELKMSVDLERSDASEFTLWLRCNEERYTTVRFDLKHQEMECDRNNADGWGTGISRSPLVMRDRNSLNIHVFVDQSSVEVFTDDYRTCHSLNVFAGSDQNRNYIQAKEGTLRIRSLSTWGMGAQR